jgi:hypothetical protein
MGPAGHDAGAGQARHGTPIGRGADAACRLGYREMQSAIRGGITGR